MHRLVVEGEMVMVMFVERRTHWGRWIDRLHLLGCLYDLSAEPTNNRAERSLRPAVISRKISCGNKTDRGRRTWQVLASLAATSVQHGEGFTDYLAAQMPLKKNWECEG